MSKREAEIYREAARIVAQGKIEYSCHAIHRARGVPVWEKGQFRSENCELTLRYQEEMLGGDGSPLSIRLFDEWDTPFKDLRVLLLCFMAAIAEDE